MFGFKHLAMINTISIPNGPVNSQTVNHEAGTAL